MPSGRTSRPALRAPDRLATLPACSGRRQKHPSRRNPECKLGDQTKDDADKEPREERSCGRSQTLLYNAARTHLSVNKDAPSPRTGHAVGRIVPTPFLRGLQKRPPTICSPTGRPVLVAPAGTEIAGWPVMLNERR